ncbi:NAD(P)-binding protein [Thozetella sp. PMI_491]|nr:NAD(P)-binding protein [Thozetella sp. PMI_491]
MAPIPKTMPGVVIEQPGGVEVLKYKTDLPVPELKEGEILVKNELIGVNYIDIYFRSGLYKVPSYPLLTGQEAAGTVVAVHPSVSKFKVGDRVIYLHANSYAQFNAVPTSKTLLPLPEGIAPESALAALLQGLTALTLIREAGLVTPERVASENPWTLVHAAAGGTGGMLVQILRAFGARIIATAGSNEKVELARQSGAQYVINSQEEDVTARVKEITGGHGADIIFDGVGKATFEADLEMVARKGALVIFGNASGAVPPVDILRLGPKNVRLSRPVLFNYLVTEEEREKYSTELFSLIKAGKVAVKIHKIYPIQDAAQAHTDLEGRKSTGKLLLKI